MHHTTIDERGTRLTHEKTIDGGRWHWLFVPGGPGADSRYFCDLINALELPGHYYRVDFANNGDNHQTKQPDTYDYSQWAEDLLFLLQNHEQAIIVGHSYGAILPLLNPDVAHLIRGLVCIGSAPHHYLDELQVLLENNQVPVDPKPFQAFQANPNEQTFRHSLLSGIHRHFPMGSRSSGTALFKELPFNHHAMMAWIEQLTTSRYQHTWVPEDIPMLVLHGQEDYVVPYTAFMDNDAFDKPNIERVLIKGAGHFPWFDDMQTVQQALVEFARHIH